MISLIKEWSPVIMVLLGMACGSAITAEQMSNLVKTDTYNGYKCTPKAGDNDK